MVVAEDSAGRRIPFGFLAELMKRFNAAYMEEEIAEAPAYGMNRFEGDIAKLMVRLPLRAVLRRVVVRRAVIHSAVTDRSPLLQKQYEDAPSNDPIKVCFPARVAFRQP